MAARNKKTTTRKVSPIRGGTNVNTAKLLKQLEKIERDLHAVVTTPPPRGKR